MLKKENAIQAQALWEKRQAFADLKCKFPSLNDKIDEELLVDKEQLVKKPEVAQVEGLKIRADHQASTPRPEIIIRPKEQVTMIHEQIEPQLVRQKDIDHHWDDQIDNPHQTQPAPYASRLFKYVPPPGARRAPAWPSSTSNKTNEDNTSPSPPPLCQPHAIRMHYGRGGRIHLDRWDIVWSSIALRACRSVLFDLEGDDMDVDDTPEEQERQQRLEERWKHNLDDAPPVGPEGADEQDCVLVDDYDATYLQHSMTLHSDPDHLHLVTDPTLILTNSEGQQHAVLPYGLGIANADDQAGRSGRSTTGHPHPLMTMQNGIPVAMQQIKKMQAPTAAPQMRISSNGGMRPPSVPTVANLQANGAVTQHPAPPHPLPVPVPQHSPPNGINGTSRAAISMPHVDVQKPEVPIANPAITANGIAAAAAASQQPEANVEVAVNGPTGFISPR
ncbi:hypothetical protein NLJ89_g10220 [Agrocybe chaxingu]|uniref:Uncharacterized protein n=1 Tax=Agrocybe chaxingu TaxID=84603 RepID=A0A9W8JRQ5_9AGAR|nr:hypothetical protein NLJ89_g10220 [Agrocybe chaxingu]